MASSDLPLSSRFWRFSLREILLLLTTIGALLALGVRSWMGTPRFLPESVLAKEFALPDQMRTVLRKIGHPHVMMEDTAGGTTYSSGMHSRRTTYRIELPPETRDRFIQELARGTREMIRRDGRRLIFDHPMPADHDRSGFHMLYEDRHVKGELFVRVVDRTDRDMQLIIGHYEHLLRGH